MPSLKWHVHALLPLVIVITDAHNDPPYLPPISVGTRRVAGEFGRQGYPTDHSLNPLLHKQYHDPGGLLSRRNYVSHDSNRESRTVSLYSTPLGWKGTIMARNHSQELPRERPIPQLVSKCTAARIRRPLSD